MAEETAQTTGTEETNEQGTDAVKEFQAITSQEDFDKAIQARIARERAKIPADYDELKAAAAELAKIREASKTEAEKQAERLAEIERENAELKVAKARAEVAAAKGVPADLLSGGTQEELEASADALIAFRGEQKSAPSSSAIGRANTTSGATTTADAFASFVEGQLN